MQRAGFEESLPPPGFGSASRGLADGSRAEGGLGLLAALGTVQARVFQSGASEAEVQLPALFTGGNGPGPEEYDQHHRESYYHSENEWRRHVAYEGQLPTSTSKGKTMLLP